MWVEQRPVTASVSMALLALMAATGVALIAGLRYSSAAAYVTRLAREQRIAVVADAPATPRGCTKRLYPPPADSSVERKAA